MEFTRQQEEFCAILPDFDLSLEAFRFIHIAGTNGKGSVGAILATTLLLHGEKNVCHFNSPHVVHEQERVQINAQNLDVDAWNRYMEQIHRVEAQRGIPLGYFKETFLVCLLAARDAGCSWIVLETGIGGKEDVTNIVMPVVSVITSIGRDHEHLLGHTLKEIAEQKAGIIKPNTPAVVAPLPEELLQVFRQQAQRVQAPLFVADSARSIATRIDTSSTTPRMLWFRYQKWRTTKLIGMHQLQNILTAEWACRMLRIPLKTFFQALKVVQWRGRMQRLGTNPPLWIDGAHNDSAVEALLENWKFMQAPAPILIFGMHEGKIHEPMKQKLWRFAHTVIEIRVQDESDESIDIQMRQALQQAFECANQTQRPILITGSLYLFRVPIQEIAAFQRLDCADTNGLEQREVNRIPSLERELKANGIELPTQGQSKDGFEIDIDKLFS